MLRLRSHRHAARVQAMLTLVPALLVVGLLLDPAAPIWSASTEGETKEWPEAGTAAAELLKTVSTAPEKTLLETPGLSPQMVAKIMAHRAGGGSFKTVAELRQVTGISTAEFLAIIGPFRKKAEQQAQQQASELQRKPVPEPPAASSRAAPSGERQGKAPIAKNPSPAASAESSPPSTGPIGGVRPFYGKLPGYEDIDKIDPALRKQFLETINREMCACGCKGETVAFCLVNDPACPVVKARARKIYEEIVGQPQNK